MSEPTNHEVRATAILVDLYPDYSVDPETVEARSVTKVAEALDKAEARERKETIKDCVAELEEFCKEFSNTADKGMVVQCMYRLGTLLDTQTKSEKKQ